jgi:hypothetical protein
MRATKQRLSHLRRLGGILLLLVLCFACSWQSRWLTQWRGMQRKDTEVGVIASAQVPPALNIVMVGLGGFRGLVAEALWFRVSRLQMDGRYIELVQLANWITMLDPKASEGWIFNAWNLAYNISVMMNRPEDRWRWVQNGIALLRDEALRFNPRDARLYRELAWMYQHKIGEVADSAHLYYKVRLMERLSSCVNSNGTVRVSVENRVALAAMSLDLEQMTAIEKRFGRVDWRMAETHALYWALQGLACASGTERAMCEHAVNQALMVSVFRGRYMGSTTAKQWQSGPNLSLAISAADGLIDTWKKSPTPHQERLVVRYLATALRLAIKEVHPEIEVALYDRLLRMVKPPQKPPTFDEIMNGWDMK